VFTFTIYHRSPYRRGEVLENIAQRQNEAIIQGVTLGETGQSDDGNFIMFAEKFKVEVFIGHNFFRAGGNYGYKI
jgi:hypothetical protein